jgi:hypothetical protein
MVQPIEKEQETITRVLRSILQQTAPGGTAPDYEKLEFARHKISYLLNYLGVDPPRVRVRDNASQALRERAANLHSAR